MKLRSVLPAAALAVFWGLSGCAATENINIDGGSRDGPAPEEIPEEYRLSGSSGAGSRGPSPNHYYYFIRAQLEAKAGRIEKAAAFLENAAENAPADPFLKKELALVYLEMDHSEKALEVADSLAALAPENPEALILAASVRQKAGRYEEARDTYEKVLTKDPDRKNVYLALARLYLREDEHGKAAELLRPFVKRFPGNYTGFYFLGEACAETEQLEEAEEAYKQSLELRPDLLEARVGLIEIYTSQDRKKEAAGQYEKFLARQPDNTAAAIELGLLYKDLGRRDDAGRIWADLADRASSDPGEIAGSVRRLMGGNRSSDAAAVLSEILEHRPGQPELSFLAGAAFYTMEDYESALRYFKALEPEDDHYGEAAVYQAIILRKQDKLGQAVGFLESAMEKADESQRLELIPYLSAFYQEEGEFRKAEGLLTEGLSREPENAELHYEMGVLYDKMGDTEAAIDKMLFVIEMDPENADALNYLGYTYADQDIRLQEAEALIRQALELDPDNGYFLDSMGWVYYRKGDYEKARQYIERAVDRVSDDPVILEHMGDVYSRLGDMQKALRYYRRAMENADEDARQGLAEKIESVDNPGGEH